MQQALPHLSLTRNLEDAYNCGPQFINEETMAQRSVEGYLAGKGYG